MSRRLECAISVVAFGVGMVLASLLLGGCAMLPPGRAVERDGQAAAVIIVWAGVYQRTDQPPRVLWVEPEDLTCGDPASHHPGFRFLEKCIEGLTLSPWEVYVAWRPTEPFSDMALAHELEHAAMARDGVFDPFHKTEVWRPGGIVERANAVLVDNDL